MKRKRRKSKKKEELPYRFKIIIGDWMREGHKETFNVEYKTNRPIDIVRKAFLEGVRITGINPQLLCSDTEEMYLYPEDIERLRQAGYRGHEEWDVDGEVREYDDGDIEDQRSWMPDVDGMADLTEWIIKQGNPSIQLQEINIPSLQCYQSIGTRGYLRGKQISSIGYGLFYRD